LGHGDTVNGLYFAPVIDTENTELTDVAFASLGEDHSMILKKDGTLWAMGRNSESQLGISGPNQLKAVKVLENVAYVAAGYNHTMAVKEDGTLWAAGSNQNGQFGQKTAAATNNLWTEIDISKILNPAAPSAP
jgi:alpha-tubulin suppressor-like RCC1 family protein